MSATTEPFPKCSDLNVEPWYDPMVDPVGHDPRSDYAAKFWLSILGPSTLWLLRHLANSLDENPNGVTVDMRETARRLGMGLGRGPKAPFIRSIERSCRFEVARFVGPSSLAVRRMMPTLSAHQSAHLPPKLRHEHRQWTEGASCRPSGEEIRGRARQLALTLLQLGEDTASTEHQLQRWQFHPAVVHEAVRWALSRSKEES